MNGVGVDSAESCLHGIRVLGAGALLREPAAPFDRTLQLVDVTQAQVPASPFAEEHAGQQGNGLDYSITDDAQHFHLRYFECCSFKINKQSLDTCLIQDPREGIETAGMILANGGLSAILGLSGVPVLHAGAVAHQGRALLLAGPSGAGKTTLTALLCQAGARLLSDDAVRVEFGAIDLHAYPGTSELRLRATTEAWLARQTWPQQRLIDDRLGVCPPLERQLTPVAAVWFPVQDSSDSVTLEALRGQQALRHLISALRVTWKPRHMAQLLAQLKEVVKRVPLCRIRIPRDFLTRPELQARFLEYAWAQLDGEARPRLTQADARFGL